MVIACLGRIIGKLWLNFQLVDDFLNIWINRVSQLGYYYQLFYVFENLNIFVVGDRFDLTMRWDRIHSCTEIMTKLKSRWINGILCVQIQYLAYIRLVNLEQNLHFQIKYKQVEPCFHVGIKSKMWAKFQFKKMDGSANGHLEILL